MLRVHLTGCRGQRCAVTEGSGNRATSELEELRPLLRNAWLRAADMSTAHANYHESLLAISEWLHAGAKGRAKVILPLGYRTMITHLRRIRPKDEPPVPPLDDLLLPA